MDDIDASVARALDRGAGERASDATDVDELDVAEEAHHVEDDVADVEVAKRRKRRIARAVELVPERIENHLAAVDAGTWEPLDLAVELRRDALDEILLGGVRLVGTGRDCCAHRIAPIEVLDRLLAQFGGEGHAPVEGDLVDRCAQLCVAHRIHIKPLQGGLDLDRRRSREQVDFGMAHPVALLEERDDLLHLGTILVRRESRDGIVAASRNVACANCLVVIVDENKENGKCEFRSLF